MSVRKRFIAGAVCPGCQTQDALAVWREDGNEVVACVRCGYQMQETDKEVRNHVHNSAQVIGIFHPD